MSACPGQVATSVGQVATSVGQVATSVGQVHNPGHLSNWTSLCHCNIKHVLFILIKILKGFDLLTP